MIWKHREVHDMIRIFTDTAANLTPELLQQYSIGALPLTYQVDGKEPEGEFDGPAYYDAMRAGAEVKTSMVNPRATQQALEKVLDAGDDVLYLGISGGISGSCWSVGLAAEELMVKYPERKLRVIDSRGASLGEGMIAVEAAKLAQQGASMDELVAHVRRLRSRMRQFFVVDDLKYLRKGGRISGSAKLAGTILQIKPILKGDEEGKIVLQDKVRGKARAVTALANLYAQLCTDKRQTVGIAHADCPADALRLHSLLHERGHEGEILTVCYEPVTGAHVGPGALALFFLGEAWR